MVEPIALDRWIWMEADFEDMGWHDCRIHAITASPDTFELLLDLDYILAWVEPSQGQQNYQFWVSPATLVFENVYDLEIFSDGLAFEIDLIARGQARRPKNGDHIRRAEEWRWEIGCHDGEINFWSVGFQQYIRSAPVLSDKQALDLDTRGGVSFVRGRSDSL